MIRAWRKRFLLLLLMSFAVCAGAAAHQVNLSTARVVPRADGTVAVEVALKGSDADRVAGSRIFDDASGLVVADRLAAARVDIAAYVVAHAVVAGADGAPCAAGTPDVVADGDGVIVRVTWSCTEAGGLVYRSTVLTGIEPAARQIVLIGAGPDAPQALLDAATTELAIDAPPPSLAETVERYIAAGIEHIFLGYDHVAFLIAIVLWARRLWPVIKIVTAFTLAHSVTLSLAALGIVVIPTAVVEPAIAVSIVIVAVENFFSRDIDHRWRITFAFGLIHGFGFAGALQEFGLPRSAVVPALASFNIGVEIGQVAIVSLVVPALIALDHLFAQHGAAARRAAPLVYALSSVITILGGYWALSRINLL